MASLRKLPSGNWQATVYLGQRDIYVTRGKRTSKTFPRRSEARRWAAELEAERTGTAPTELPE